MLTSTFLQRERQSMNADFAAAICDLAKLRMQSFYRRERSLQWWAIWKQRMLSKGMFNKTQWHSPQHQMLPPMPTITKTTASSILVLLGANKGFLSEDNKLHRERSNSCMFDDIMSMYMHCTKNCPLTVFLLHGIKIQMRGYSKTIYLCWYF